MKTSWIKTSEERTIPRKQGCHGTERLDFINLKPVYQFQQKMPIALSVQTHTIHDFRVQEKYNKTMIKVTITDIHLNSTDLCVAMVTYFGSSPARYTFLTTRPPWTES